MLCWIPVQKVSCRRINAGPKAIGDDCCMIVQLSSDAIAIILGLRGYDGIIVLTLYLSHFTWTSRLTSDLLQTARTRDWRRFLFKCEGSPWATRKRATLFLIITLAFLGRFLYSLHRWKQERIGLLYNRVNKIYHFTLTVSPHYLVKLKRHLNSTFWSQSSQCVRLFATYAEIFPMFFFSNSW